MSEIPELAVIGGSGLYQFAGLTDAKSLEINTPFGKPSAPITVGSLDGHRVAFLARHGIGHTISPSEINYRANIYALKSLGAHRVVSISACGSLRDDYAPGHIVIPDQLFDFTRGSRARTFFGDGLVVHVGTAEPFCSDLTRSLYQALKETGAAVHKGGTFITIEGPRFSTRAESNLFRIWGMSVIGMTASPEAFLAREAEMCYIPMAHVTDYDVWHATEGPVSVEVVIRTLNQNTQTAQQAIRRLLAILAPEKTCHCATALADAIITHPNLIPPETRQNLDLLVNKYI